MNPRAHQPPLTRRGFLGRSAPGVGTASLASLFNLEAFAAEAKHPFDLRPQPWQRRAEPILSARTTRESWCKVVLYSPHVLFHEGKFRMWYLGTSTGSRSGDIAMGYAESADGVNWTPHAGNPIFTARDIGWGDMVQTPCVLFDGEEAGFKMWFVSGRVAGHDAEGRMTGFEQRLGYATSRDGIQWKVHPEPIYRSGRSPFVIKEVSGRYRMWMGSSPDPDKADGLLGNLYTFDSMHGIRWRRDAEPIIRTGGRTTTAVYVSVLKEGDTWYLWHGGHVAGGRFEIFCAASKEGTTWQANLDAAAFPSREGKTAFDSRYTSTPRVVSVEDRSLLYYGPRLE